MKAEIVDGVLVLYPQNETEIFAANCWVSQNTIKMMGPNNIEAEQLKSGSIKMSMALLSKIP